MLTFFLLNLLLCQCLGFWINKAPVENQNGDTSVIVEEIEEVKNDVGKLELHVDESLDKQTEILNYTLLENVKANLEKRIQQVVENLTTTIKESIEEGISNSNCTVSMQGNQIPNTDTAILVLRGDIDEVRNGLSNLKLHIDESREKHKDLSDTMLKDVQEEIQRLIQKAVANLSITIEQGSQEDTSNSNYTDLIQENEHLEKKLSEAERKAKENEDMWGKKVEEAAKSCTCNESNNVETPNTTAISRDLECGPSPVHLGALVASRQSRPNGGDTINYECQYGFKYIQGSKSAWCYANETMEMPTMDCEEPTCSRVPVVAGATLSRKYRTPDGHVQADYICKEGLKYYSGTTTVECTGSGKWVMPTILCASEDCFYFNGKKAIYDGPVNVTMSGRNCQRWDSNTPHGHPKNNNSPKEFDTDSSMDEVGNKCRDPEDDPFPWCYTMDPKKRWEYCNVKLCDI